MRNGGRTGYHQGFRHYTVVNIQTNVTVHEILFITFPVRSPDAKLENVVVPRPYFL